MVLFAGQIVPVKGVADLLHAWSRLPQSASSGATLVIVGDDMQNGGAYRREMETLSESLKVSSRFVGFRKDVPKWLMAADIAVVPSHIEPLGNATLEAMSFGLPIIGSRTGGIPEMIVHGETGWLVLPENPEGLAEALAQAIGDKALRASYGQAGRKRCECLFSLEVHTANALRMYDTVLARARRKNVVQHGT